MKYINETGFSPWLHGVGFHLDKIEGIISFTEPSDKRKKEKRRWSLSGNVRFSIENNTWTCRVMKFLFKCKT